MGMLIQKLELVANEKLVLDEAVTSGTLTIDGTTVTATPAAEEPEVNS